MFQVRPPAAAIHFRLNSHLRKSAQSVSSTEALENMRQGAAEVDLNGAYVPPSESGLCDFSVLGLCRHPVISQMRTSVMLEPKKLHRRWARTQR